MDHGMIMVTIFMKVITGVDSVALEPCKTPPCSDTDYSHVGESQLIEDAGDVNETDVTITELLSSDNISDIVTSTVSDATRSVIKNQTLISSEELYKNVTEDFWSIFLLNSTLSTWRGNMTFNLNSTSELPDLSQLNCDFLKDLGAWNTLYKFSNAHEELDRLFCMCTGICKKVTLAPDVKQKVHEEVYGALSDKNRHVFIAVVTVYSLLLLIGLTGNMTTIIGLLRWIKNSTPTFVFIVSLSISDLLLLCVCMPIKITEYFHLAHIFTEPTCKLSYYVRDFTLISSVLTLTVISFERYYAICHPLSVQYRCTWNRARIMILITWLVSAALALPTIFMTKYYLPVGMIYYECLAQSADMIHLELYFTYYLGILFVLPLLIMTFTYGRSCMALWRSARVFKELQGRQRKFHFGSARRPTPKPKDVDDAVSRRKVIKLLIIVVIIFMCCWGPPLIVQLLSAVGVLRSHRDKIRLGVETLTYISSALNPYLFIAMSSNKPNGAEGDKRLSCRRGTLFGQVKCHVIPDRYSCGQSQRRRVYFAGVRRPTLGVKRMTNCRILARTISVNMSSDSQEEVTCV